MKILFIPSPCYQNIFLSLFHMCVVSSSKCVYIKLVKFYDLIIEIFLNCFSCIIIEEKQFSLRKLAGVVIMETKPVYLEYNWIWNLNLFFYFLNLYWEVLLGYKNMLIYVLLNCKLNKIIFSHTWDRKKVIYYFPS